MILDELCELPGWHRDHARKAPREVLRVKIVRERKARPPIYGEDVIVVLRYCWAVTGTASGRRMAPFLGDLVPRVDSSKVRAGPPPRVTPTPPAAVGSVPGYAADRHVNGRPGTMSARYSGSRVGHHHENLLDVLIGPQRGRLGEVPLRHGGQRGWAEPPAPAQVSVWVTLLSPRGASGFSPSARARPSASS